MVSIMVMSFAYLGIMTLFMDVIKSHTQDQIVEEVRFSLSGQLDQIANEIKNADAVEYEDAYQTTLIKILERDQSGDWKEKIEYRHDPDRGVLVNGEQKNFYSNSINHLFEGDGVYELEITNFTLCSSCPGMDAPSHVRDNMYELIAEFELTSKINDNFIKTLEFKNEIFTLNQFSRTLGDD